MINTQRSTGSREPELDLKRRIANESGRRSRDAIFKKISDCYATFAGREWRLDVVYASGEPGAEIVPVMCNGALPVGDNGEGCIYSHTTTAAARQQAAARQLAAAPPLSSYEGTMHPTANRSRGIALLPGGPRQCSRFRSTG